MTVINLNPHPPLPPGITIKNNYACDLDSLGIGTRIGMMRHRNGDLHYYVNGVDQSIACSNLPPGGWARALPAAT